MNDFVVFHVKVCKAQYLIPMNGDENPSTFVALSLKSQFPTNCFVTTVQELTQNPFWNEEFFFKVKDKENDSIQIDIYNYYDDFNKVKIVDTISIPLSIFEKTNNKVKKNIYLKRMTISGNKHVVGLITLEINHFNKPIKTRIKRVISPPVCYEVDNNQNLKTFNERSVLKKNIKENDIRTSKNKRNMNSHERKRKLKMMNKCYNNEDNEVSKKMKRKKKNISKKQENNLMYQTPVFFDINKNTFDYEYGDNETYVNKNIRHRKVRTTKI